MSGEPAESTTNKAVRMYGFFTSALEKLIRRRFGDDKWEEICELAEVSLGESCSFQVHHHYDDNDINTLLQTATNVLGLNQSTILEMFGEQFLLWCMEYGQSQTLKLLGRSLQDFLANLDSLHDHVSTLYPQMIAPSFRCSPGRKQNEFLLHYHSQRDGLEPLVVGLVKAIAREYFKTEVRVVIFMKKGSEGCDHSIFTVQEIAHHEQSPMEEALRCSTPKLYSDQQLISVEVFCKSFPFHIVFNRNLEILQCGTTLSVLLSGGGGYRDSNLLSHFILDRPQMKFSFDGILSHINTFFILRMTTRALNPALKYALGRDQDPLSLRGQMIYLRESDSLLFLCSPRVKQLHDLERAGLYLSDIPLHDATRGLLMIGQAAESEFINSVRLEELIVQLQSVQKSLEEEKQRMAGLLREMLPITVADSLMAGKMVEAERFECVTILFSDIVEFTSICSRSEPMEIVNMLNKLYSCFDQCVDQNQVYKVETIGDAYMVVGGLPQRNITHAECVANQALDMMYYCRRVHRPDNGNPIKMRIGIHSGNVVAGIVGVRMPRYCLFGNTVNVASRAECNGVPGRIQVTEYTYNLLKHNPQLSFTYRGPMEFKNVPDPIPCYFLLENSAKSKPTPVTVPFSEDLVYDLFSRPSPFSGRFFNPSPPLSPNPKSSSHLTVPSLSQDDIEAPPIPSPRRPLSRSSASSSSTLQSRSGDDIIPNIIPGISIGSGDDVPVQQLIVPVPDISVTAASSSPSPISNGALELNTQKNLFVEGLNRLSENLRVSRGGSGSDSDESITPESPFMCAPPATLEEACLSAQEACKKPTEEDALLNFPLPSGCPFSGRVGEGVRWSEGPGMREERVSVSAMSPLREEATEDSLYSSFEGSEISDHEPEDRRQRREREGERWQRPGRQEKQRRWRDSRRKGETVQPRLLTVGGGRLRVGIGPGGDNEVQIVGTGQLDGGEDMVESIPVRKISDCSSRSNDSGTKMSEVSNEECQRKLSDLSEASQQESEGEGVLLDQQRRDIKKSINPQPSTNRRLHRSDSVHNKIEFFNKWIIQHQHAATRRKRSKLLRTRSEVMFNELSLPAAAPRRGSLFTGQEDT